MDQRVSRHFYQLPVDQFMVQREGVRKLLKVVDGEAGHRCHRFILPPLARFRSDQRRSSRSPMRMEQPLIRPTGACPTLQINDLSRPRGTSLRPVKGFLSNLPVPPTPPSPCCNVSPPYPPCCARNLRRASRLSARRPRVLFQTRPDRAASAPPW